MARKTNLDSYAGKEIIWAGDPNGSFSISYMPFERAYAGNYNIGQRMDGTIIFTRMYVNGDELLHLHAHVADRILNSMKKFWASRELYKQYGYLWKRGFFFYGPQGSGKSSAIRLILDEVVKQDGVAFFCSNPYVASEALRSFRLVEPERPIVLVMEDIDNIINHGDEVALLALLDGENQVDNVIYIATTNHPDQIPQRIINRPSRFDEIILVDTPDFAGRREYLKYKLPKLSDADLDKWASATPGFSIAHMKELIISVFILERSLEEAVEGLKSMRRNPPSEDEFYDNGNCEYGDEPDEGERIEEAVIDSPQILCNMDTLTKKAHVIDELEIQVEMKE